MAQRRVKKIITAEFEGQIFRKNTAFKYTNLIIVRNGINQAWEPYAWITGGASGFQQLLTAHQRYGRENTNVIDLTHE